MDPSGPAWIRNGDDVDRNRLAKDPFADAYLELTSSSFGGQGESHAAQEEMDFLSRQIRIRVEVIGKQIAALSKEAYEHVQGGRASRGSKTGASNVDVSYGNDAAAAHETRGVQGSAADLCLTGPVAQRAFASLHERVFRGLATAEDLLPSSVRTETGADKIGDPEPRCSSPPAMMRGRETSDRPDQGTGCSESSTTPAGLLHYFIKKVHPFLLCAPEPADVAPDPLAYPPVDASPPPPLPTQPLHRTAKSSAGRGDHGCDLDPGFAQLPEPLPSPNQQGPHQPPAPIPRAAASDPRKAPVERSAGLAGKRKLVYSSGSATSASGSAKGKAGCITKPRGRSNSSTSRVSSSHSAVFTLNAARQLQQSLRALNASAGSSADSTRARKSQEVTLPVPDGRSARVGLSLCAVQPGLAVPAPAEDGSLDGYLLSLVSPARDLTSMRAGMAEQVESCAGGWGLLQGSPSQCHDAAAFPEPDGAEPVPPRAELPPVDDGLDCSPAPLQEAAACEDVAPPASPATKGTVYAGGDTCMVDLHDVRLRTGAVCKAVSEAAQANEKRGAVKAQLRSSVTQWLQHQQPPQAREPLTISLPQPESASADKMGILCRGAQFRALVFLAHKHNTAPAASAVGQILVDADGGHSAIVKMA